MSDSPMSRRELLQALGGTALATSPASARSTSGAHFAVSVRHTPSVVTKDSTSVATGTITNTGDESDVQIVELEVKRDGEVVDSQSTTVSLEPNESHSERRIAEYDDYPGPGSYVGEACSADDCATATWTVKESSDSDPAFFNVELSTLNSPTAGNPIEAECVVSNTGDESDTQELAFTVGDRGSDETTVSLGGGDTTTASFSVPTSADDVGEYTATISSADDSESQQVTVAPQPAFFAVDIDEVTQATAGEPVDVTVDVSNTGDKQADQDVTLDIDGLGADSQSVSLAGGETTSVTLSVPTEQGDDGEYTATISSADDSESQQVAVAPQPAFFAVDIEKVEPATAGEPVDVAVSVGNTGDKAAEQELTVDIEGLDTASRRVSLGGGGETTVSFSIPTEAGDAGEYTVRVVSDDDSGSQPVVVEPQPAYFAVTIEALTASTAGGPVEAVVDVENTGGQSAQQEIALEISELGTDSRTVSLSSENSTRVPLAVATEPDDTGEYTVTVSSDDERRRRAVTLTAPTATPPSGDEATPTPPNANGDGEDTDVTQTETGDGGEQTVDDDGAGLGVGSAVAGLGGVLGYLFKRRIGRNDE